MPLQTKKSQQVILTIAKQRNKKTGEERTIVQSVKPVQYEFECEALADFAYQLDNKKSNVEVKEKHLLANLDNPNIESNVDLVMPSQFTYGKMVYSQVKDPNGIKKGLKMWN